MKIPTAKDYPHLLPTYFEQPKNSVINALQKFKYFERSVSKVGTYDPPLFRCQMSIPNNDDTGVLETLVGEGRSKVGYFKSMERMFHFNFI